MITYEYGSSRHDITIFRGYRGGIDTLTDKVDGVSTSLPVKYSGANCTFVRKVDFSGLLANVTGAGRLYMAVATVRSGSKTDKVIDITIDGVKRTASYNGFASFMEPIGYVCASAGTWLEQSLKDANIFGGDAAPVGTNQTTVNGGCFVSIDPIEFKQSLSVYVYPDYEDEIRYAYILYELEE